MDVTYAYTKVCLPACEPVFALSVLEVDEAKTKGEGNGHVT